MADIEYKRVTSRVTASEIIKIEERKLYPEDLESPIQCWLILKDGSEIRCHRQKECECPVIGDYRVKFYKDEKSWHMTKEVFERQFIKISFIDKIVDNLKRLVKRG